MGKLAQIKWPPEYSELQRIEELLLCGICYEYLDTSVMTPCSHNYCSLCIRKYLHYKTQCPACFEKTFEKDLHTNRILDELVSYFSTIREKLVECIAGAKIMAIGDSEDVEEREKSTPVRPARNNHSVRKSSPKVEMERVEITTDNTVGEEKNQSLVSERHQNLSSPSTSAVYKVATIFTPKSKKNSANAVVHKKTVPCPVCRVEVSEIHINKHLDDCLKRETVKQEPERIEPKRKPLPKLVFSLMKDAELRKKMKDLGLPSQGDRKTLEARFHRYSTLYNAECDKKEPRPIEELLRQCENDEILEKKMLKIAQAANRLKITRNCEQNIIEEEQKKYLEHNRQNYRNLIAAIKERDENRKLPVRRSLIDENVDRCDKDVSKRNCAESIDNNDQTDNDDDLVNYSMNAFEATFQDSDSSTSCPLQHYASDDPMNFLSFKMTTSEDNVTPPKIYSKSKTLDSKGSSEKPRLETSTLPIRKFTPPDVNNDSMTEEVSRSINIYCAITDNETSDEDVVPPSPDANTSRTTKRPKLSLRQLTQNSDDPTDADKNRLEGQKLAMSIARDFTFDGSSNDSIGSGAINESVDKQMAGETTVQDSRTGCEPADTSKVDKENHESPTTCSPTVVNRPVRKRNSVVRSKNMESNDTTLTDKKATTIVAQDESGKNIEQEDEKLSQNLRVDSPLKRRRRRKTTPSQMETNEPPRRPLRRRLVNSVSTNNAQK